MDSQIMGRIGHPRSALQRPSIRPPSLHRQLRPSLTRLKDWNSHRSFPPCLTSLASSDGVASKITLAKTPSCKHKEWRPPYRLLTLTIRTGEMGSAYVTGLQSGWRCNASTSASARMASTCKHFAAFGSPQGGLCEHLFACYLVNVRSQLTRRTGTSRR